MNKTWRGDGSDRGVLYVATGDQFAGQAAISARSIRQSGGGLPTVLVTDRETQVPPGFDHVERTLPDDAGGGDHLGELFGARIDVLSRTPFERTLFLDADTYVVRSLDPLFALLDRFELAAAHAPNRFTRELSDVPEAYPEFNCGVLLFRRSALQRGFFADWLERYRVQASNHPDSYDQPPFRAACYHSGLRVATLPSEWNCRFTMGGYVNQPVGILHGWAAEADYRRIAAMVGRDASRRDSYLIFGGGVAFEKEPRRALLRVEPLLRERTPLHRLRSSVALRTRARRLRRQVRGFGRGVVVLGMHRSGTSAAARAINLLGVPIGDPADLIEAEPSSNPTGHWESGALAAFNDRLLQLGGGTWSSPPELPAAWEREPAVRRLADEARETFERTHPDRTWMWKDPRLCLTLPFWRRVLTASLAAVLVVRHPVEVARSLEARNGLALEAGLSLWERYNRAALDAMAGLPALVTTYESLLADPRSWVEQAATFLAGRGFAVNSSAPGLDGFLDRSLRHSTLELADLEASPATPEQRALYELLLGTRGVHPVFLAPPEAVPA